MRPLNLNRRSMLIYAVLAQLGLVGGAQAQAQANNWPNRPIKFVTQSAAGDPVDLRLREFLNELAPQLKGAVFIVDNKPGAGGLIAHQAVLNQPADGNTVLVTNATMTIFPTLYRKLSYNPLKDFAPVAFSGIAPIALAIPASRPEKTLKDWTAWAKQQKNTLNYASPGNASVSHLYGYQLTDQFGLGATHIPYKGAMPALMDMLGGQVHFMMLDTFSLRPLLMKGDVRVLAVTGDERSKFLPDVPTFKELGHAGYERTGWTAYYMRAGTPPAIVAQLAQLINGLNATPGWVAKRDQQWSEWTPLSPAAMGDRIRSETEAWAVLIRKNGFYAD